MPVLAEYGAPLRPYRPEHKPRPEQPNPSRRRTNSKGPCYEGIKVILELAEQLGIPTSEEDLQPYDAYTAAEVFLANSGYCTLPVSRIDNRPVRGDVPGSITERLLAAWSEMVGVDIVDQALHYAAARE